MLEIYQKWFSFNPFQNGSAVIVKDVKTNSPVTGKSGLELGNVIYEINGCNVTSRTDWRSCIKNLKIEINYEITVEHYQTQ